MHFRETLLFARVLLFIMRKWLLVKYTWWKDIFLLEMYAKYYFPYFLWTNSNIWRQECFLPSFIWQRETQIFLLEIHLHAVMHSGWAKSDVSSCHTGCVCLLAVVGLLTGKLAVASSLFPNTGVFLWFELLIKGHFSICILLWHFRWDEILEL